MSNMDLNRIKEKLRNRSSMGVNRNGQLREQNPNNDGSRDSQRGLTTLKPERFFIQERR